MSPISTSAMRSDPKVRRRQEGAFLLEALIGILIFSLGILGIVGLQARAIRYTNDAQYRAEAMYLANSLIATMWTDNIANLKAKYDSTMGGAGYTQFVANADEALKGAAIGTVVTVDGPPPLPQKNSVTSSVVQVVITWQMPGDTIVHNYTTTGVIGQQK